MRFAACFISLPALLLLAACEDGARRWEWRDLGALPAPEATALNHTPLAVSGDRVLVGTGDGIWARPLDGTGGWSQLGLAGISVFAIRLHPTLAATVFAAGQPGDDPQAAPFWRTDDGGMTWVPSASFPRNPFDDASEAFYDLPSRLTTRTACTPISLGPRSRSRPTAGRTGRSPTARPTSTSAIPA